MATTAAAWFLLVSWRLLVSVELETATRRQSVGIPVPTSKGSSQRLKLLREFYDTGHDDVRSGEVSGIV